MVGLSYRSSKLKAEWLFSISTTLIIEDSQCEACGTAALLKPTSIFTAQMLCFLVVPVMQLWCERCRCLKRLGPTPATLCYRQQGSVLWGKRHLCTGSFTLRPQGFGSPFKHLDITQPANEQHYRPMRQHKHTLMYPGKLVFSALHRTLSQYAFYNFAGS